MRVLVQALCGKLARSGALSSLECQLAQERVHDYLNSPSRRCMFCGV